MEVVLPVEELDSMPHSVDEIVETLGGRRMLNTR